MEKVVCIVDGYNAGKAYIRSLNSRNIKAVHIQSTKDSLTGYNKFDSNELDLTGYIDSMVFDGDLEQLLSKLKKYNVLFVIPASEVATILADQLSSRLCHDISNGTLLSEARRDKQLMIEVLKKSNIPTVNSLKSNSIIDIKSWVKQKKLFPYIIKPIKSAGTDGVFVCHDMDDIVGYFNQIIGSVSLTNEINEYVVVQEFIEGDEYVVNSISYANKHYTTTIWRYKKSIIGSHIVYDYGELVEHDGVIEAEIIAYVHKVSEALGIKFGSSHAEVKYTERGPILIEIAARLGGDVKPDILNEVIGCNDVDLLIDTYMTKGVKVLESSIQNKPLKYAAVVDMISYNTGVIKLIDISVLDEIGSFRSISLNSSIGHTMHKTKDLNTSPASIYLVNEDKKKLDQDIEVVRNLVGDIFKLEC